MKVENGTYGNKSWRIKEDVCTKNEEMNEKCLKSARNDERRMYVQEILHMENKTRKTEEQKRDQKLEDA